MYIGEVARQAGASPKAIRHYESLGLLGRVGRAGVYRVYSTNDLLQVQLIKQAQQLGFRLHELQSVLVGQGAAPDWPALVRAMQSKRLSIQQEVLRLQAQDRDLALAIEEISGCSELGLMALEQCDLPGTISAYSAA